ncbi:DUF1045 domain-containing protein [Verminephrobacter aporrectodeae subsp. tuberculatae]|uniref:DUF1045 domain-containing protein n=1 Tax=Verminephrobacter aporrectodeae subsp. tuberculatae TaxID=1110392 RepID=A0ABT3KWN5_9BURK|nr:DUF1045 domain-containing protein [Verminephrobacter aporrectodeae]MCW5258101.1 DUF1045 domain-containing protein [Verminephrobacter aporrectodeae subsp. tuberculatae]MCW5322757.1 DUF1045 domain-containing protein [Verminephrobacter aporrectodeae subsp. tuberculatae]
MSALPEASATAHRYAVYFAPRPGSPGWLAGSRWLGRCAATRQAMPQPEIDGVAAADLHRLTAAPRRYGWHATLKAPFALAPGIDRAALHQAVQALARSLRPFDLPPLEVARMDDFLALLPMPVPPANAAIDALAAACVTQLQPLAAPLSDADLARRRRAALTPRQDELLQRWGYPFVLGEFRFHLSLTGSLRQADRQTQALLQDAARAFFRKLPAQPFDGLALFAEPAPGADFVLLDWLELGA